MATSRPPRRRPDAPTFAPTSLTECARRYAACGQALARVFGLPFTEAFVKEFHEAIACVYIEAGRAGLRLPSGVQLPPLVDATVVQANGHAEPPVSVTTAPLPDGSHHGESATGDVTTVTTPTGDTPPLTVVPPGLPCAGQAIEALKLAQLALLISKTARQVHDEGAAWVPLLGSLQSERARRLKRGRKTHA